MLANSKIATNEEFKKILGKDEGNRYLGEIKHQHMVAQLMCNPPNLTCWQGECQECEDSSSLLKQLENTYQSLDIENITYKQWESTDRTELVTYTESIGDFIPNLIDKLQTLKKHQFIHDQQTKYFYL